MALYTGRLALAEAFAAPLRSRRPDAVADGRRRRGGSPLGFCIRSTNRSPARAGARDLPVAFAPPVGKGRDLGHHTDLLRIDADCDRDCLRFTVRQQPPGFCHLGTRTCWGEDGGLGRWRGAWASARPSAPAGSYTARLFADPELLAAKLREEAAELAEAETRDAAIHEAADVLYFTLTALARHDIDLAEVERALARRALKVTRRS